MSQLLCTAATTSRTSSCTWRRHGEKPTTSSASPPLPSASASPSPRTATTTAEPQALRESGNEAFRRGEHKAAVELYSQAIALLASNKEEQAGVLTNRSNANFALGKVKESRADALKALALSSNHVKALFRLALAEERLGNTASAIAALSAGACYADPRSPHFASFTEHARKFGAWRLPPPLLGAHPPPAKVDEPVAVIGPNATRDEFMAFVEQGQPVIVREFADVQDWSWAGLIERARAAEKAGRTITGDVLVSASGCVPDYCRGPTDPHCSRVETMTMHNVSLRSLFERVSQGSAIGGSSASSSSKAPPPPLMCHYEKVYSYGKGWMLADEDVSRKAAKARPKFINESDLVHDDTGHGAIGAAAGGAGGAGGGGGVVARPSSKQPAGGGASMSSTVCWVGSSGCLTPLHYDCSDGLLAQVLGEKRVWLFPPEDMDHCYLRSSARPGINNWDRQSQASLHGAPAEAWPLLKKTRRLVADLAPGDCLYIPSDWLHEVHSRTASFSLGWRIGMVKGGPGGGRTERTTSQKLERMANAVKTGSMSIEETLNEALSDPSMVEMMGGMMGGGGGGMPALPAGMDPAALSGMMAGMNPAMMSQMMSGLDPSMLSGLMGGGGGGGGGAGGGRRR